ncbi:MAG: 3-deoxy-7-phosphoheptulonate synthase [Gammaproteobacteria bacterium]|nr:3-deoxy-7-phosphoheptulonate synthase [Gammaproteobacteria bacterium]
MSAPQTDDVRVIGTTDVIAPSILARDLPLSPRAADTVLSARRSLRDILAGRDPRLICIVGPCSIHDPLAARDYAARLHERAQTLNSELFIVMRSYFEKPRTTVGWKGLVNDPGLDNSYRINDGLHIARGLLLAINELGLPVGTEFLDPISPQYVADLVAWGAIGARTTESQVHRELASGLSCPIGFKNGTDGSVQVAIDAAQAASHPHHFLGVTKAGTVAVIATAGNPDCHVILRGGTKEPNYSAAAVAAAAERMTAAKLRPNLIVDVSHANSRKDHQRQIAVGDEVAAQVGAGDRRIVGIMIESFLVAGRQESRPGQTLTYGQSITDACINWDDTADLLGRLAEAAARRRG